MDEKQLHPQTQQFLQMAREGTDEKEIHKAAYELARLTLANLQMEITNNLMCPLDRADFDPPGLNSFDIDETQTIRERNYTQRLEFVRDIVIRVLGSTEFERDIRTAVC